jgi:chaperonin GroES
MIAPLSDIVIIRRLAPQQVSDGGIHLVYDPDYREDIGEVAYVGPGNWKTGKPVEVKPGDKVLFSTNGHQITHVNGEELVVLREPSIIGVFE